MNPEPVAAGYIAFRRWVVRKGTLRPAYYTGYLANAICWQPGQRDEAYCFQERHDVGKHLPAEFRDCECGFYGFWKLQDALNLIQAAVPYGPIPTAVGAALFWGSVVEHELGLRARFARPVAFLVADPEVAETYGVPILERAELEALAAG